jgi:hypothetical protein
MLSKMLLHKSDQRTHPGFGPVLNCDKSCRENFIWLATTSIAPTYLHNLTAKNMSLLCCSHGIAAIWKLTRLVRFARLRTLRYAGEVQTCLHGYLIKPFVHIHIRQELNRFTSASLISHGGTYAVMLLIYEQVELELDIFSDGLYLETNKMLII